jgi:hypothetical protein
MLGYRGAAMAVSLNRRPVPTARPTIDRRLLWGGSGGLMPAQHQWA